MPVVPPTGAGRRDVATHTAFGAAACSRGSPQDAGNLWAVNEPFKKQYCMLQSGGTYLVCYCTAYYQAPQPMPF